MLALPLLLSLLGTTANAAVSIYTNIPGLNAPLTTSTAPYAQTTGNSAYSSLVLTAPDPPGDLQKDVPIALQAHTPAGVSVNQKGSFLGFSVELSVADAILGYNSTVLNPTFLNYMANLKERIGHGPTVRVGGNSQDESVMYPDTFTDAFGHQRMIQKYFPIVNGNPTWTPNINFAVELLYTMSNITALVDVEWYFGLAFDQPYNNSNAMEVAQAAEDILGGHLIAFQLGNEPDLYAGHGRRDESYGIPDYFTEYGHYLNDMEALNLPEEKIILGPSVCCTWSTQQVLDAGYLTQFGNWIKIIGVMHYPANNCAINGQIDPQSIFANYLSHKAAETFVQNYIDTAPAVMAAGLPFVVLETNTASCGGFPGLSDSFGAALWGIDNALALAGMNFTQVLLHIGGQKTSYNPFTPPPTNMSKDHMWTTGAIYYSTLFVAAEEGMVYMPYWMMQNLLLQEGDIVQIKNVTLPKGSYVKLQPHTKDFLDISNPKAILETTLRNYSCLTTGDSIMVPYNNKKYYIDIVETKPTSAISIIETDCEVDFAPPLDYKEPERSQPSGLSNKAQVEDALAEPVADEQKYNPFSGSARRLDGKPSTYVPNVPNLEKCSQPEAAGSKSSTTSTSQSSASRKTSGKLVFGSNAGHATKEAQRVPPKEEPPKKEEPKFEAFTGKKYSLKG